MTVVMRPPILDPSWVPRTKNMATRAKTMLKKASKSVKGPRLGSIWVNPWHATHQINCFNDAINLRPFLVPQSET